MFSRRRVITILASLGIAIGALFTTGSVPARADTQHELYLDHAPGWCATYGDSPYDQVLLGRCADAPTQHWYLHIVTGNIFEIVMDDGVGDLCVTYDYANGHADGGYMITGVCANAQTQEFQFQQNANGGWNYVMPYRKDNNGHNVTFDDASYRLVVYNHIDGSYWCTGCGSEQWSQLFTTP